MLKAEQIPPDAMYAAWKALDAGMTPTEAITAAINAWPGMEKGKHYSGQGRPGVRAIILPLTQENTNAE